MLLKQKFASKNGTLQLISNILFSNLHKSCVHIRAVSTQQVFCKYVILLFLESVTVYREYSASHPIETNWDGVKATYSLHIL